MDGLRLAWWAAGEALQTIRDVRELLPVAERHGQDAAVTVYRTVLEADGVKVTAALLKGAAGVIADSEQFDPVQAAAQIRAYLAGEAKPGDPGEAFTAETERLRAVLTRTVERPAFLTYARTHPEQARAVVAELRALLDDIEQAATTAEGPK
ncbi:hypothetical protein [Nonomuraea sp. NPDC050691]|uniref:hypothetical protein n=1 Tax=Nonomuraea sp. NPDC050691 TaxID=3155661 RepID=UPI0033EB9321